MKKNNNTLKLTIKQKQDSNLGSLIYKLFVSKAHKNKGLDGWKDDKEKFKLELLNDIKTFLFGKWEKPWTPGLIFDSKNRVISGFRNVSGRVYKNESNILSMEQKSGESPYFITLSKLKNDGGKILDKDKTLSVLSFIPMYKKGNEPANGEIKNPDWMLPKFHPAINVDFVEGIKKPKYKTIEFEKLELNEYVENFIKKLKTLKRIPKLHYDQADQAFFRYSPDYRVDEIHLVKINQFKKIEAYYSTLFHEIIHSTKNPKRSGRGKLETSKTLDYANEELVAEMGAMIVCSELGLEYNRQNSITYLKGWMKGVKGNPDDAFLESYAYACDAAEYLLDGIDFEKLVPKTMKNRVKEAEYSEEVISKPKATTQKNKQLALFGLNNLTKKELRLICRFHAAVGKERQRRTIVKMQSDVKAHIKATKNHSPLLSEVSEKLQQVIVGMRKNGLTHVTIEPSKKSQKFFDRVKAATKVPATGLKKESLGKPKATTPKRRPVRSKTTVATKVNAKPALNGTDQAPPAPPVVPDPEPVVTNRFQVDLTQKPLNGQEPEKLQTEIDNKKDEEISGLFTPITAQVEDNGNEKIDLPGDLGKFLGYVERYEYSILLRGEKGAGKTRMMYQMMNTFAKAGFKVGCFSLEIGKQSNIVTDMRNTYISPIIANNVFIADSAPNGLDDIRKAAKQFDVIAIDSWGKIPGVKSEDFDTLRKEFPETMFIIIFQSTTNGTARGGSAPEYDAGIVIQVAEGGRAYCEKNRYSGDDLTYLVFERKLAGQKEPVA